jgi:hypothetical protein
MKSRNSSLNRFSYSLRFKWLAHPDDNKNAAVAAIKTAEQLDPETSGRPGATFQWRHGPLSSSIRLR